MMRPQVIDDVLPDIDAYVEATRRQAFATVEPVAGRIFHGIGRPVDLRLLYWIAVDRPRLMPTMTFLRQSPKAQVEPHFVHTDLDMGEWTGLFYLNPTPAPGDGTVFYRWRRTGEVQSTVEPGSAAQRDEVAAWSDAEQWEEWHRVAARCNRLVLFPARYFHSRAIPENYGEGDDARLLQVVFGTGKL